MALRLTLGQYYPGGSLVHRLDPRTKLACSLACTLAVFFIGTPPQLAFGLAGALAATALAQLPARKVIASIRPLVAVLLVLSLFNLLFVRGGETLLSWRFLTVTTAGVHAALIFSMRLVVAVMAMAILLLTTTPTQLTDAFDAFLEPLARLGLPGHELAMVFSLMLRFIPTLADETQAILDAQSMRGAALGEGSPARRLRSVVPVLVALLASSIHHAEGLSRALDARCYAGGAGRSHWHPLRMTGRDWLALAVVASWIFALILLGHAL